MWFDDDDDENTPPKEPVRKPGDYNLGDDIGERIGEDTTSEDSSL